MNLEFAKSYLKRDFSVIPLAPRSKTPLVKWVEFQDRLPGLLRRFGITEEVQIAVVNRALVGEKLKTDHALPISAVEQHDRNLLHPAGLSQGQGIEQFIECAEAAGEHDKRLRP